MIRALSDGWEQPKFVIEEVTDPAEIARSRAVHDQHKRNSDWLESHWGDLLPQARGKFVAVAGQQAFIADSVEEAVAWIRRSHPADQGAIVQYVHEEPGHRIYASRR